MLETEQHAVADHDVILGKSEQGYLKPNGALGEGGQHIHGVRRKWPEPHGSSFIQAAHPNSRPFAV